MKLGILAARQETAVKRIEGTIHDMGKIGLVDQSDIDALTAIGQKNGDVYQMKRLEAIATILDGIQAKLAGWSAPNIIEKALETPGEPKGRKGSTKKATG